MKSTFRQRFQYQFDNLMSRGTPAMIGMLFVFSLIIVIIAGAIISAASFVQDGATESLSFGEAAWESLMRTLDSGTMGGDTGTGFRIVMLFVTLGGIFVVSALIGVLNNAYMRWLTKTTGEFYERGTTEEFMFMAGLVFIISQVFRRGVEIQSENELTV